ncbi:MAG: hypothetical protein M3Q40_06500 [Pseudomonadota bacterium]|nr:hypothetical protein [Pseudomonadota bacterium]
MNPMKAREPGKDAFAVFLQRMGARYRPQLRDIAVMAWVDGRHVGAGCVAGPLPVGGAGTAAARGQHHALPGGAFLTSVTAASGA